MALIINESLVDTYCCQRQERLLGTLLDTAGDTSNQVKAIMYFVLAYESKRRRSLVFNIKILRKTAGPSTSFTFRIISSGS